MVSVLPDRVELSIIPGDKMEIWSGLVALGSILTFFVVVVYLATRPWGVSESQGGDVPASDSHPSVPRLLQ